VNAKLQGWLRLSNSERWRFVLLLLELPAVSLLLAMIGYSRTRRAIERCSSRAGTRNPTMVELAAAERLAQLATLAGTHGPLRANCLRQSLLTYLLLRRQGFCPALQLGARRQDGQFDAHAWVELEGQALGQADLQHRAFQPRSA